MIEFNQPLMIRKEDLSLTDALANEVAIDECSSDGGGAGTMQLTCLFDEPTGIGRFTLRIADTATDRLGARLDGEWQNPNGPGRFGDLFPSGDGEPGGDFSFRFDLNLGDTNLDGRIDISDLNNVRNHFGESANSPGDADGDGDADIGDLNEVRNRFGSTPTAISDSAPSVVLRNLARDAIFGMLTSSAGEKPIRRDIARGNEVR